MDAAGCGDIVKNESQEAAPEFEVQVCHRNVKVECLKSSSKSDFNGRSDEKSTKNGIKHNNFGQKQLSCSECGYVCIHLSRLKRHELAYTGEKIFSCDKCNFQTVCKQNLIVHMYSHTGEKPITCDECIYNSELNNYTVSRTLEQSFSCDECSFNTNQKRAFKNHRLSCDARLSGRHFLHPVPRTEAKGSRTRRKCHVCSHTVNRPRKRKDTKYMCTDCNVALCICPCFKEYHTKIHY